MAKVRVRSEEELPAEHITLRSIYKEGSDDKGKFWQLDAEEAEEVRIGDGGPLKRALEKERATSSMLRKALPENYTAEQFQKDQEDLERYRKFEPDKAYEEDVMAKAEIAQTRFDAIMSKYLLAKLEAEGYRQGVNPADMLDHAELLRKQISIEVDDKGNITESYTRPDGAPFTKSGDKGEMLTPTLEDVYAADRQREERRKFYRNETAPGGGTTTTQSSTAPEPQPQQGAGFSIASTARLDALKEKMGGAGIR